MRSRFQVVMIAIVTAVVVAVLSMAGQPVAGQGQAPPAAPGGGAAQFPAYRAPRTADGKADLNGIWQAFVTANIDVQDHEAQPGPRPEIMGTYGAWPAGQGIVEGGEIPYKPEALAKKKANADNRTVVKITSDPGRHKTGDPELKCYRAGLPRANYMPFPFQIIQGQKNIMFVYEYAHALRTIIMDPNDKSESPADSWMGWSHGRWEGDTLVIDTRGFVEYTWFDRAGNYHSDALHVIERYTPASPYHILYEATIEDPNVFTRPWKVSFPLYRRMEKNVQLLDFNCVEFSEEMMYGHLRKPGTTKP